MTALDTRQAPAALPPFPRRLLRDHISFLLLIWPAFAGFVFLVILTVSQFRDIEISGWDQAEQAIRWWAAGVGGYVGWQWTGLYLTHGATRREVWWTAAMFIPVYAVALAAIAAVTLLLEAAVYDVAGWQHVLSAGQLHTSASQLHLSFLNEWLIFTAWGSGGFYLMTAFYRGNGPGSLAVVVVIVGAGISGIALSADWGPFGGFYEWLFGEDSIGGLAGTVVHLALIAGLLALSRAMLRGVAVRSKSA